MARLPTKFCFGFAVATVLLCALGFHAQESTGDRPQLASAEERAQQYRERDMEELVVEGERLDPASMALPEMHAAYTRKQIAARNFKVGAYEKAFPTLLELAKLGFKDSQARVGYIYMHGLGGQQKSNFKALGWLGVATVGETRPQYRNIFNQMMSEVPEAQRELVAAIVQDYRAKYNSEKLGVQCMRSRTGHLDKFTCRWEEEMRKQMDNLMMERAAGNTPW